MTTPDTLEALDAAERAMDALYGHSKKLYALARAQVTTATARLADDDEWTRMPPRNTRCGVSGWSRTTLETNAKTHPARLRTKLVQGARYYSAADVRAWLKNPP